MRVNCREQIANPAEPVNSQDERRKCAAVDSPARVRKRLEEIAPRALQPAAELLHVPRRVQRGADGGAELVVHRAARVNGRVDQDTEDYITQTLLTAIFKFRFGR